MVIRPSFGGHPIGQVRPSGGGRFVCWCSDKCAQVTVMYQSQTIRVALYCVRQKVEEKELGVLNNPVFVLNNNWAQCGSASSLSFGTRLGVAELGMDSRGHRRPCSSGCGTRGGFGERLRALTARYPSSGLVESGAGFLATLDLVALLLVLL